MKLVNHEPVLCTCKAIVGILCVAIACIFFSILAVTEADLCFASGFIFMCGTLFTLCAIFAWVIPIYAYQFCDAGGEYMSDNSYSALYKKYCSDHGFENENGHEEEFSEWMDDECINYDDSDGMILYAATVWGNEFAMKVQDFCNENKINDIHAGNWGIVNGDYPIICDYAGYGDYVHRGIISVF